MHLVWAFANFPMISVKSSSREDKLAAKIKI